ncbi:hypothetical protein QJS10_CPB21g01327 [Acorus calamus]|uniref:Uncharacterized protein n=1 Tax=Acorus calamus TaxID=4465 RepID=A0AAV9C6E7_ACOCL|nr:hypothetical protein QJS10_CPB21g01327 [Acorus calamus]
MRATYGDGNAQVTFPSLRPQMSFLWKGWSSLGVEFTLALGWKLGNGGSIRFWMDRWCGDLPFCQAFPNLLRAVEVKEERVQDVWHRNSEGGDWRPHLWRLTSETQVNELAILLQCLPTQGPVGDNVDVRTWGDPPLVQFSVKAGYAWWTQSLEGNPAMALYTPKIWKWKIPCKGHILTKVYQAARGVN